MAVATNARGGIDARLAGARLTVDLGALADNYRALSRLCAPAETAGVVKADAYGLGLEAVAPALAAAGCRTFFVALPHEGVALRAILPGARIFVLAGLSQRDVLDIYLGNRLIPVLNSAEEASLWEQASHGEARACAIHIDTGMNRLGMTPAEARSVAEENALTRALDPVLVMTHLACADDKTDPMNAMQAETFGATAAAFGNVPRSIANSAGILIGRDYHMAMTRPGIAVYGGSPAPGVRMRPVVTVEARISQIRHLRAGETISYGATIAVERDTTLAVATIGYADGYHRSASGSGVPLREALPTGGHGFIAARRVPILGRVTMDATMFDVTDCGPDAVARGDWIELIGANIPLDEVAEAAGTIAYEVLTGLGRRYHRIYAGGSAQHG